MKAASAKPMSLTRTTLMPAAAAERSSARTASIDEPRRLVRSQLTPNATSTRTTRHRMPKAGRGKSFPDPMPRFMPNSRGVGMFSPLAPPSIELLSNQMASTPAANVKVTTPSMKSAYAQGRDADNHAGTGGYERGEQRGDREGDAPRGGEGAEDVGRHAREGQLRQRDLSRVSRHDDERERDDRRDEARIERGAVVAGEDVDRQQPQPEPDDRRRDPPAWARCPAQGDLGDRAPARHDFAADGEHHQHENEWDELAGTGGEVGMDAVHVDRQRLQCADAQAGRDGPPERVEAPDHRRGQGRHDEEGVGAGHQRHQRRDEDAGDAAHDEADHPVDERDAVGGQAAHQRTRPPSRPRPGREAEAGEAEQDGQHDPEPDDRRGQPEAVGGEVDTEEVDVVLRKDRVDLDHLRAHLVAHHGGQEPHQPDGGDRFGDWPVVAQGPEHQQVGDRTEHRLNGQGHQQGGPEGPARLRR